MTRTPALADGNDHNSRSEATADSRGKSRPELTLTGYYATRSIRGKKFVANFKRSAKRNFDSEDRMEAHRLRKETDFEFRRTLDLARAAVETGYTDQIKAMMFAWIAEVIRQETADLAPGAVVTEAPPVQAFRSLTQALNKQHMSWPLSAEGASAGQTEMLRDAEPPSTPAQARAAVSRYRRSLRLRRSNLLLLTYLYLSENRGLSLIDVRPALADALRLGKKAKVMSAAQTAALLAAMPPDRLARLLDIVGQWDTAMNQALEERGLARNAEAEARSDAERLRAIVASKETQVEALQAELQCTRDALHEAERAALAERQRLGAIDRERRGRLFRFLSEKLAQRIAIAEEALGIEPPVVDVARETLQEMETDRAEEAEWLKSSE